MLEAPAQARPVIESLHVKLIGKRYYYYLILSHATGTSLISDSLEQLIYNKTFLAIYSYIIYNISKRTCKCNAIS